MFMIVLYPSPICSLSMLDVLWPHTAFYNSFLFHIKIILRTFSLVSEKLSKLIDKYNSSGSKFQTGLKGPHFSSPFIGRTFHLIIQNLFNNPNISNFKCGIRNSLFCPCSQLFSSFHVPFPIHRYLKTDELQAQDVPLLISSTV